MSKVFICAAIPDEQVIKEEGAVAVATAIEAGDERRAAQNFTGNSWNIIRLLRTALINFLFARINLVYPALPSIPGMLNICRKTAGMRSLLPLSRLRLNQIR